MPWSAGPFLALEYVTAAATGNHELHRVAGMFGSEDTAAGFIRSHGWRCGRVWPARFVPAVLWPEPPEPEGGPDVGGRLGEVFVPT